MANLNSGQKITTDGDYDIPIIAGRTYSFEVVYVSGTGTFTAKQGFKYSEGTAYQNMQFPNSTTDAAIAATGTARGFQFKATGDIFRLTLASASSLVAAVKFREVPHGR